MDLNDVVYKALFDWVKLVLPALKVLKENTDAPKPGVNYIVVPTDFGLEPQGRPHYGAVVNDERTISQDYSGTANLWEVGGTGDNLRVLSESLAKQAVQLQLKASGISIRYMEKPQSMPQVIGNKWLQEARAVAAISVRSVTSESIKTIETVESTLEVQ